MISTFLLATFLAIVARQATSTLLTVDQVLVDAGVSLSRPVRTVEFGLKQNLLVSDAATYVVDVELQGESWNSTASSSIASFLPRDQTAFGTSFALMTSLQKTIISSPLAPARGRAMAGYVEIFTSAGALRRRTNLLTSAGPKEREALFGASLAVYDSLLYVSEPGADSGMGRVHVFEGSDSFSHLATFAPPTDHYLFGVHMAIDSTTGHLFISSLWHNDTVVVHYDAAFDRVNEYVLRGMQATDLSAHNGQLVVGVAVLQVSIWAPCGTAAVFFSDVASTNFTALAGRFDSLEETTSQQLAHGVAFDLIDLAVSTEASSSVSANMSSNATAAANATQSSSTRDTAHALVCTHLRAVVSVSISHSGFVALAVRPQSPTNATAHIVVHNCSRVLCTESEMALRTNTSREEQLSVRFDRRSSSSVAAFRLAVVSNGDLFVVGSHVDGAASAQSTSACSTACGVGTTTTTYACDNPHPQHGGASCAPTSLTSTTASCSSYTYSWYASTSWSLCSLNYCGSGSETRTVECRRCDNSVVSDSYCVSDTRPASSRHCVKWSYRWETTDYDTTCRQTSRTSTLVTCGTGNRWRTVRCLQCDGSVVADSFCLTEVIAPRPQEAIQCEVYSYAWHPLSWSICDCGTYGTLSGEKARVVQCWRCDNLVMDPDNTDVETQTHDSALECFGDDGPVPALSTTDGCVVPGVSTKMAFSGQKIFDDDGSGADDDVSVYLVADGVLPSDYFRIGDTIYSGDVVVVKGIDNGGSCPSPIGAATGSTKVWDDDGSGADDDMSFWHLTCPSGYTSVGDVAVKGHGSKGVSQYRCIIDACVSSCAAVWAWDDSGSGADDDVTVLHLGGGKQFLSWGSYNNRPSQGKCIKSSCVV